ncbi:MAG: alpha/beta hydrolase [Oceanihabitans sp.]|nr:alpha/beta hydrolase [Oceanihabitans sp.]
MKNSMCYLSVIALLTFGCVNTTKVQDVIPNHDNFSLHSSFVEETRVINVWLPPNYESGTDAFPVLYMPDGGIKEDFPHIANTIAKLVESKNIPSVILVGIENTERGRDLTGFSETEADAQYCPLTDGAKNFRAFITEELMLQINTKYRTTSQKGIIGESLAGLFVMETFLVQPNAFDFYIAMDPSLWWNNHYLEQNASAYLKAFPNKKKKLWFAGSGVEDISIHTNNLAKTLQSNSPRTLIWKYEDAPNEKHNTIFRATKEQALTWIMSENN